MKVFSWMKKLEWNIKIKLRAIIIKLLNSD